MVHIIILRLWGEWPAGAKYSENEDESERETTLNLVQLSRKQNRFGGALVRGESEAGAVLLSSAALPRYIHVSSAPSSDTIFSLIRFRSCLWFGLNSPLAWWQACKQTGEGRIFIGNIQYSHITTCKRSILSECLVHVTPLLSKLYVLVFFASTDAAVKIWSITYRKAEHCTDHLTGFRSEHGFARFRGWPLFGLSRRCSSDFLEKPSLATGHGGNRCCRSHKHDDLCRPFNQMYWIEYSFTIQKSHDTVTEVFLGSRVFRICSNWNAGQKWRSKVRIHEWQNTTSAPVWP